MSNQHDIVQRLRATELQVWSLDKDAANEIESLRQQLAETKEELASCIEDLDREVRVGNDYMNQLAACERTLDETALWRELQAENKAMKQQLAECERERDVYGEIVQYHEVTIGKLNGQLATVTAERDELKKALQMVCEIGCVDDLWKAQDAIAKLGADKTGEKTPQVDAHWPSIRMDISEGVCGTCKLGAENCDVDLDGHCGGLK